MSHSWAPSDPRVFFHRNATGPQATAARALTFWNSEVEEIGKFDIRSQVIGIASQFEHRRCAGAVEQVVKQPLVLEDESGQIVRQSEDNVEIRNGQQFTHV